MKTTRFSGADWADQLEEIMIVGIGGIGSWLTLNLSRIGHNLYIVDPDMVDETNVTGGQMYRDFDIGRHKVHSVVDIARQFGCTGGIISVDDVFTGETGVVPIMMTGLDSMEARKLVFEEWNKDREVSKKGNLLDGANNHLLIDGRLTMEMMEIIAVQGSNEEQIERYKREFLFDDEEADVLDCTTKQSTFGAMMIASLMTATLCNFLTNKKLGEEFREVPFYQRFHLPIFNYKKTEVNDTSKTEENSPTLHILQDEGRHTEATV